jgi:excisionase family DNA binding protein
VKQISVPAEPLWTVREAAAFLRLTATSLYRLVEDNQIPYIRVSERRLRFRRADLENWLNGRRMANA